MNIKLLTVASHPEHAGELIHTLQKFNWPYELLVCEWQGFGTKILVLKDYLLKHAELDGFFFCDAFDVLMLGKMEEAIDKIRESYNLSYTVFGAERGCWPDGSLAGQYMHYEHGYNYLNSGLYYSNRKNFLSIIGDDEILPSDDDQYYFSKKFLSGEHFMALDNDQIVFNNHSFIREGEYTYDNDRIGVNVNFPVCVHKNGRTVDPIFNERIKI